MRIFTDLYFIRHGETVGNSAGILQGHTDCLLSENGRLQAQAAAEELKDVHFTAAYSSDLVRASETARIILRYHPDVALVTTPRLEEWDVGELQGRSQLELLRDMPQLMSKFRFEQGDFDVPGGESRQQFQQRISSVVDDILAANRGGCVLLVSHGWVSPRLLRHLYGLPDKGVTLPVPFNAGICQFRYFNDEKTCQLMTWNSASHLKKLPVTRTPVE